MARLLAAGGYALARVVFKPIERMASVEKKANMVYPSRVEIASAPILSKLDDRRAVDEPSTRVEEALL